MTRLIALEALANDIFGIQVVGSGGRLYGFLLCPPLCFIFFGCLFC